MGWNALQRRTERRYHTMTSWVTTLAVLLAGAVVAADVPPEPVRKAISERTIREVLGYKLLLDECGFSREQAAAVVDGEMEHHGVGTYLYDDDATLLTDWIVLFVVVECFEFDAGYIYDVNVNFSKYDAGRVRWNMSWGFGMFGYGDADAILRSLRRGIEVSATDFIFSHGAS